MLGAVTLPRQAKSGSFTAFVLAKVYSTTLNAAGDKPTLTTYGPRPMSDLTIGMLKRDVQTQLEVSREVLDVAKKLKVIAEHEENETRRKEIYEAINQLVRVGNKSVTNARTTGNRLVGFVRAGT
jgi:hypothetical protein